jgi:hypothetical protein
MKIRQGGDADQQARQYVFQGNTLKKGAGTSPSPVVVTLPNQSFHQGAIHGLESTETVMWLRRSIRHKT